MDGDFEGGAKSAQPHSGDDTEVGDASFGKRVVARLQSHQEGAADRKCADAGLPPHAAFTPRGTKARRESDELQARNERLQANSSVPANGRRAAKR